MFLLEILSVRSSKKRKFRDGLLLKRWKDSWADMRPMSTLSEEQRQHQYLADVVEENADRQTRSFPFSDNLKFPFSA